MQLNHCRDILSTTLALKRDATNFSANAISLKAGNCLPGKLVVCESRSDGAGVKMASGMGTIMPGRSLVILLSLSLCQQLSSVDQTLTK